MTLAHKEDKTQDLPEQHMLGKEEDPGYVGVGAHMPVDRQMESVAQGRGDLGEGKPAWRPRCTKLGVEICRCLPNTVLPVCLPPSHCPF